MTSSTRRLAAIPTADVAGYSRLIAEGEARMLTMRPSVASLST